MSANRRGQVSHHAREAVREAWRYRWVRTELAYYGILGPYVAGRLGMLMEERKNWDWSSVSSEYAQFRDIYPQEFFSWLAETGVGRPGQRVLDTGTGTGAIPRAMAPLGAVWTGVDVSERQLDEARKLSGDAPICWQTARAEDLPFPDGSFDAVTAVQCFWYFDAVLAATEFSRVLVPNGWLIFGYLGWLADEDAIARSSEQIILKYNPHWSGAHDSVRPLAIPDPYLAQFQLLKQEIRRYDIPFTRETWHGRLRACRGTRLEMSSNTFDAWDRDHRAMLAEKAPESFTVPHYAVLAVMRRT